MITTALLRAATGCTQANAELYAGPLSQAREQFGINTSRRLAAFLAQIGHESVSLAYVREIASGEAYEGRRDLGNTQPGDGRRFRGHGLIQITGRSNHAAARDRLLTELGAQVPDFEADPEALMLPRWACLSAAEFWARHGCNELADGGDFDAITQRINGGQNGRDDRRRRWVMATAAIDAEDAAVPAPPTVAPAADPPPSGPLSPPAGGSPDWPPPEQTMIPVVPILAGIGRSIFMDRIGDIVGAIPRLAGIFAGESAVAQRNVKAVEIIADTIGQAVGAKNAQEVVEAMQDPAKVQAAREAIDANWSKIHQAAEESMAAAREFGLRYSQQKDVRVVALNMTFLELLTLLLVTVGMVGGLCVLFWGNVGAALNGAIITLILIESVVGVRKFWLGNSQPTEPKKTP